MPVKNALKKIGFVDEDEGFIIKLAKAIGCYYSKANERTYNLNRFASDVPSKMGIFAWVHKEGDKCFWISTRKIWVEEARTKLGPADTGTRLAESRLAEFQRLTGGG